MMRESMPVAELGWDGALSRAWRRIRAGKGLRSRIALSLNPLGGGRLDDDGPRDRYSYAHPAAAVGRLRQPIRNRRVAEPLPSRHLSGHDHAGRPRIPKRDGPMLREIGRAHV